MAHRDAALPMIAETFPEAGLLDAIDEERQLEARAQLVRAKFSGKKVMTQYPELSGKRLGEFIRTFKNHFADFEAQIAEMSPEAIGSALREHHARFRETH